MNNALFGYTGLVGSTLLTKYKFDYFYNSKNINDAKYKQFNTIFICCIPAIKWFANKFPEKDEEDIENIKQIFKTIKANHIILISTIDIYVNINNKSNENTLINYNNNHTYGKNRYLFELFIIDNFINNNINIIRLPALFGQGLKKNIIYDLINNNNINLISTNTLFQWYNLEWLKDDIDICINNNIKECNLFTEPVDTNNILHLFNYNYDNNPKNVLEYNTNTKYSSLFNSNINNYIRNKEIVFNDIKKFIIYQNNISKKTFKYKLCVSNISNHLLSNIQYYSILKYYGIKYIEIAPTKFYDWELLFLNDEIKNMQNIINETNNFDLNIYSFQSITYTINNNIFDIDNSNLLNHCKKVIDLACNNNVKNLVFGCPRNRKIISNNILYNETIFINFMRELGNYINTRELIISIENNSKSYNCNFLNTIDEVGNITLKINHPKIKMMIDIGNILMENDNFENILKYKDIIYHIHISTPFMHPLNNNFLNNNNNINYYKKFITILNQIDYNKIISLEFLNNNDEQNNKQQNNKEQNNKEQNNKSNDEYNELKNLNESLYNFINLFSM
jgi:sugar phosphate isomerase/epimerase